MGSCHSFGNISIGDNTEIGAEAVVVKSIPQNCVVVPENSLIIREKEWESCENKIIK